MGNLEEKVSRKKFRKSFYDIEIKLISVLSEMEINGIKLNKIS